MPRTLKIILKLIAGIALIVILVFFGLLWYVNSHKEKVLKLVNTELNNKLDGTIVIGDTPRDIACARADDLRCFAVTTGRFGPEELAGADGVAGDAAALRGLLESALSG